MRVLDIGTSGVLRAHGVTHPLLVPGSLVHSVVVATARGNGDLIKFRVEQNGTGSVLSTCGIPVDADPIQVVVGIPCGRGFVPENAILKTSVLEVLPTDIVEGLGTIGGAHAIDLHDDKAQVR